ncbi:MAG: hypothetical protein K8T89_18250 [Planctomycetes bacterium]|nr:hypothetical protein [Planctomycetota bacterium]
MDNDYLCLTLLSREGESEADFKSRLSQFWTHMLREHEELFERVYAEKSDFEKKSNRLGRQYLIEMGSETDLEVQCRARMMDFEALDLDEIYTKYDATPPEWFWIEH